MTGDGEQTWASVMLAGYGPMMTLQEVAAVLNVDARKVRVLVRHPDPASRILATKINGVWRFPRDELVEYLLAHAPHSETSDA
jgi:hypothetical protein